MDVYHRTDAATAILEGGFRDGTLHPINALLWPGVWVSSFPLGVSEGAKGDDVLRLAIPETLFTEHEFVNEDGTPCAYREALIPAALLNAYAPFTLLSAADVDALEDNDPRFHP
jgi:hypothetical protein